MASCDIYLISPRHSSKQGQVNLAAQSYSVAEIFGPLLTSATEHELADMVRRACRLKICFIYGYSVLGNTMLLYC